MKCQVCPAWIEAAARGRVKLAPDTRLMAVRNGRIMKLARSCPFCGALLYRQVAGRDTLSRAGQDHWAAARYARPRAEEARPARPGLLASILGLSGSDAG